MTARIHAPPARLNMDETKLTAHLPPSTWRSPVARCRTRMPKASRSTSPQRHRSMPRDGSSFRSRRRFFFGAKSCARGSRSCSLGRNLAARCRSLQKKNRQRRASTRRVSPVSTIRASDRRILRRIVIVSKRSASHSIDGSPCTVRHTDRSVTKRSFAIIQNMIFKSKSAKTIRRSIP